MQFFLTKTDKSLIHDGFEAWTYGPVHQTAYDAFKRYGEGLITTEACRFNPVTRTETEIEVPTCSVINKTIIYVADRYGYLSASQLVSLTHIVGGPWHSVMTSANSCANIGLKISNRLIKDLFKRILMEGSDLPGRNQMTKKSQLPETDLARAALLPDDQKWKFLQTIKSGNPLITYRPFRNALPAIFNARPQLLDLPKSKWADIETAIKRSCVNLPASLPRNLEIAEALFKHVQEKIGEVYHWDFRSVPTGRGGYLKLWHDFYFIENGRPVICYVDPRLTTGLDAQTRDFCVFGHASPSGTR